MDPELTAEAFVGKLKGLASESERAKIRKRLKREGDGNKIIGVRMKYTFDLAKEAEGMPIAEIEKLLESPYYEARVGAVSIMDFKARKRGISDAERKSLYDLYINRHDRINDWDLVDRAAPRVVGWYLLDKPKDILYELAQSANIWERRTAITAAFWFIRQGELKDALRLSELLLRDEEELIHTSVGTALREIGKQDERQLVDFLDRHSTEMPRVTLRYAAGRLAPEQREFYLRKIVSE